MALTGSVLALALACGGLKTAAEDAEPASDAGAVVDGGAAGVADAEPPPPDAGTAAADAGTVHLVFVTSAQVNGAFATGKTDPWAAADEICATEARANNLSGTFVAWLSFNKAGTAFNAVTRITDAAYYLPGTIADGGAPVLVAASRAELLSEGPRVQMDRLATGEQAPQDENSAVTWVWTGSTSTGTAASLTCKEWTSSQSNEAGTTGNARRIPQWTKTDWTTLGGRPCDVPRRFYCFQQ